MTKKQSNTKVSAQKTIHATFQALKAAGGELTSKDVHDAIQKKVKFNEWETGTYEKSGYLRWKSVLAFYSIDAVKAGYLLKDKGVWILTDEGHIAAELSAKELLADISKKYWEWHARNKKEKDELKLKLEAEEISDDLDPKKTYQQQIEEFEATAADGIREHVLNKTPREFEEVVAVLLGAMGYYTHVTKKGKDGGVDVYAYSDPLGAKSPRIKVQVKHRPDTALGVEEIRSMNGVIKGTDDVGLIVTSGRFTRDAEILSKEQNNHIELINFERFIELWQTHYGKMSDEDKGMIPLHAVYFLGVGG